MTTKNIFNHPNYDQRSASDAPSQALNGGIRRSVLDRTRHYLGFVQPSGTAIRNYIIQNNGAIIAYDQNDFIKNHSIVTKEQQDQFFFTNDEQKLRNAEMLVFFEEHRPYMRVWVWRNRVNYLSESFVILKKLAWRLNRKEIRLTYVTSMDRQNKPVGVTKVIQSDDLLRLKTRVVPLF